MRAGFLLALVLFILAGAAAAAYFLFFSAPKGSPIKTLDGHSAFASDVVAKVFGKPETIAWMPLPAPYDSDAQLTTYTHQGLITLADGHAFRIDVNGIFEKSGRERSFSIVISYPGKRDVPFMKSYWPKGLESIGIDSEFLKPFGPRPADMERHAMFGGKAKIQQMVGGVQITFDEFEPSRLDK